MHEHKEIRIKMRFFYIGERSYRAQGGLQGVCFYRAAARCSLPKVSLWGENEIARSAAGTARPAIISDKMFFAC